MTLATFIPALALLLLVPCVLISQQVGTAIRTLYAIWATRTLIQAGYPHYDVWREKSDTNRFVVYSAWFIDLTSWLGSFWIMVTIAGLLLGTDVLFAVAQGLAFMPWADGSTVLQAITFVMLATSLLTHDYGWGRFAGERWSATTSRTHRPPDPTAGSRSHQSQRAVATRWPVFLFLHSSYYILRPTPWVESRPCRQRDGGLRGR